ncbi:MAG: DUF1295 domain-containing protein [bacterium]
MTVLIVVIIMPFIVMTIGAAIAHVINNTSFIDVCWSIGVVVTAWMAYLNVGSSLGQCIFTIMITLWGLRLASFLFFTRSLKGKQDPRYTVFEKKWGKQRGVKRLRHFYLQASLQVILCSILMPVYSIDTIALGIMHYLAIGGFSLSLVAEAWADWQKYTHKKKGDDTLCREGLWRLCRHPNYFFDCCVWVSLAVFASQGQLAYLAWVAPLMNFIIVRFMSGPYTERLSLAKRGDAFARYQKEVPMFFPFRINLSKNVSDT